MRFLVKNRQEHWTKVDLLFACWPDQYVNQLLFYTKVHE